MAESVTVRYESAQSDTMLQVTQKSTPLTTYIAYRPWCTLPGRFKLTMNVYFTRPFSATNNVMDVVKGPIVRSAKQQLPAGSYVFFAKVIVRTLLDSDLDFRDDARASFSLEPSGLKDLAHIAMWHSRDQGVFQPEDTTAPSWRQQSRDPLQRKTQRLSFLRLLKRVFWNSWTWSQPPSILTQSKTRNPLRSLFLT
jgi:hypothetical protein